MNLKYVLSGYASIMTAVILDLWSAVILSGSGGIYPTIIRARSGYVQIFFYLLGFLLLCRGMQLDMKDVTKS